MSTDEHQIKCAVSFIKASCCLLNASLRRFVPLVFFPQRSRQNIMKPLKTNPLM